MKELTGIVISITTYRENDGIVNMLCADGIVSFLARGMMKIDSKFASLCQLYYKIRVDVEESRRSSHLILKEGQVITSYSKMYDNLEVMISLGIFVEITRKLVLSDNAKNFYDLLSKSIEALSSGISPDVVRAIFISQAIVFSGLKPYVDGCVRCKNTKGIMAISDDDGGFVCQKCYQPQCDLVASPLYIKLMRYMFISDYNDALIRDLPQPECRDIFRDLCAFLMEKLDLKIKNLTLLEKIQRI